MSKLKLGVIIFITFIIGVGIGSLGSNYSSTGRVSSNNKEDIRQTTVQTENSSPPSVSQTSQETLGKVEVKSHTKKVEYGYPKIVGEVVNNSANPVTYVKITATFYDSEGQVVGTDYTYAGDTSSTPLTPKATTPFELTGESGLTFDTYKLDVTWN